MYVIPPYRFTSYGLGILLGFILQKFKDHELSKNQIKLVWFSSIAGCAVTAAILTKDSDPYFHPLIGAVCTITFCMFDFLMIFAARLGQRSWSICYLTSRDKNIKF